MARPNESLCTSQCTQCILPLHLPYLFRLGAQSVGKYSVVCPSTLGYSKQYTRSNANLYAMDIKITVTDKSFPVVL